MPRNSALSRLVAIGLGLLLAALIIQQTRSLYVFPQPDAMRWDGDETWLMREFQTQVEQGILRDPDAPLSSMEHGNGLLLNSVWINAALYGVPASLFFPQYSLVDIGRTITFLISLLLILYAYHFLRRCQVPAWLAISACILLVGSRAFFYASHSARYDLLTALGVLLLLDFLTRILGRLREKQSLSRSQLAVLFLLPALSLAWTIHLPRIVAIPYLLIVAILAYGNWKLASVLLAANLASLAVLMLPSYFLTGHLSLFPPHPKNSEFVLAFSNIPILHTFSSAVLRSTFVERFVGLKREAPLAEIVFTIIAGIGIVLIFLRRNRVPKGVWSTLLMLVLFLFSWAVSARFVSFYGIYILPIMIIGGALVTHWILDQAKPALRAAMATTFILVAISAAFFSARDASIAHARGNAIASSLQTAASRALTRMNSIAPHSRSIVLANLQLQDFLQKRSAIRCINSLYKEYPADSVPSLAQFICDQHVNFLLMETKELNLHELDRDGCQIKILDAFQGTFDDWGYNYFNRSQRPEDTLLLLQVMPKQM